MDNIEDKYIFTRGRAILLGIIIISFVTIFVIIKVQKSNASEKYKVYETELKAAAENYVAIKNIRLGDGEEVRVNIENLIKMNLVYNDLKDSCKGYVMVSNEKNIETNVYEIIYRPYIKCGSKYVTTNYSEY